MLSGRRGKLARDCLEPMASLPGECSKIQTKDPYILSGLDDRLLGVFSYVYGLLQHRRQIDTLKNSHRMAD